MARYRMEDGTVVDTDNATINYEEAKHWDGRNFISAATGQQWNHQILHRSRKGRYYIEHWSQMQGSRSHAEWVSHQEAVRWLTLNEHEIPKELQSLVEEVTE